MALRFNVGDTSGDMDGMAAGSSPTTSRAAYASLLLDEHVPAESSARFATVPTLRQRVRAGCPRGGQPGLVIQLCFVTSLRSGPPELSNMQLTIYPESHRRPTRTPTRNAVTDYVPGRQRCRPLFLA